MDGATGISHKPLSLLVCAMGGEGGGVLTGWVVEAARAAGHAVQATSVPGVAQRTGATTYYVEMAAKDPAGRTPVLALFPVAGEVDVVLASELAEAVRAVKAGYVTPERTALIASTHRVFLMPEKLAMGDGRLDPAALENAARAQARQATLIDMAQVGKETGAPISAVLLGALAGAKALPIERAHYEAAIRASRIAVDSNLAAFAVAHDLAASGGAADVTADRLEADAPAGAADELAQYPAAARPVIAHGIARLSDYQDAGYATFYRRRLEPFAGGDPLLLREVARQLALRMSYEDVIRVAQLKARAARFERIKGELGLASDDPFVVQDFFKPGVNEFADVLPPRLAHALLRLAARNRRVRDFHIGMKLKTTTVSGYLRVWTLAKMRRRRRRTYRFQEEQAAIESWLGLVRRAADRGDVALAREIVEIARLIKGYGDTHARGAGNYRRIVETLVVPALDSHIAPPNAAVSIKAAREAALADPEGKSLDAALAKAFIEPADKPLV